MKLDQIQAFTAVVETKSIKLAAERLCLTSSAISKKIASLEEFTKFPLLKRTTRSIHMTRKGNIFYERCLRILAEVQHATNMIHYIVEEPQGSIYVHASIYLGKKLLLPKLKAFQYCHPKVYVNLQLADRVPSLESEKADIFWGVSIDSFGNYNQHPLFDSKKVLVASPDYVKQHGTPNTPHELMKHYYIALTERRHLEDEILLKSKQSVSMSPKMTVNTTEILFEMACSGMGIVNLYEYEVEDAIAKGTLVRILEKYPQESKTIYGYSKQSGKASNPVDAFIDFFTG